MTSPHDSLFCQVFSDPQHAAGELRALLPAEVERQVAWRTLERLPTTYKDVAHGDRHADLLFGVRIGDRPALLYVLLEHKSFDDPWAALQLLGYVTRILDQYHREHPEARRLPPIVSMVVHHSPTGWRRGTELIELFDLDDTTRPLLGPLLPRLRFLLDDLSRVSPEELGTRMLTALAHLVLRCLQGIREGDDVAAALRELRDTFHAAWAAPDTGEALSAVLSYVGRMRDIPRDELRGIIRAELGPHLEDVMTSTYDQVLNEGRQQGLLQGKAEGKAEGKADTLLKLLAKRFGEVPADIAARVHAADIDALDRWTLGVVDARRLDEVFAGP